MDYEQSFSLRTEARDAAVEHVRKNHKIFLDPDQVTDLWIEHLEHRRETGRLAREHPGQYVAASFEAAMNFVLDKAFPRSDPDMQKRHRAHESAFHVILNRLKAKSKKPKAARRKRTATERLKAKVVTVPGNPQSWFVT